MATPRAIRCELYRIANLVDGKMYIGVGNAPYRMHCHLSPGLKGGSRLVQDAVAKYGRAQFRAEILVVCPDHRYAYECERRAITAFGTLHPNGYNLAPGGEGCQKPGEPNWACKGKPLSAEHRAKISASERGKKVSHEVVVKLKAAGRARWLGASPEERRARGHLMARGRWSPKNPKQGDLQF